MNNHRHVSDSMAAGWLQRLDGEDKPKPHKVCTWVRMLLEDRDKDRTELRNCGSETRTTRMATLRPWHEAAETQCYQLKSSEPLSATSTPPIRASERLPQSRG